MKHFTAIAVMAVALLASAAQSSADGLPPCPPSLGPGPTPLGDRSPVWSPSGRTVAVTNFGVSGWTIQLAAPNTHLRRSLGEGGAPATWSPDGRSLATTRSVRTEYETCWGYAAAIFVLDTDGGATRRLVDRPHESDYNPKWSPDGTRIAYQYYTSDGAGIAVVSAAGGEPTTISFHPALPAGGPVIGLTGEDDEPVWSPDSRSIVFSRQSTFRPGVRIWVAAADGSGARLLTHANRYGDWSAHWSPDGRRIAFARSVRTSQRIWVMNADGSDKRPITARSKTGDLDPHWSPDGRSIAFSHGDWIATIAPDGGSETPVARGYDPEWSPDGTRLAFTRWPKGKWATRVWIEVVKPAPRAPKAL